ncbi:hypothetical protein C1H76_1222 [Elsinoe australis]|uniref:Nucleotide-diphospho-sugar transferase n=1 Tax=Elsinoe australis TaxID=40998 RepID=A0A4U7B8Z6_9PEZI|nr:hypothetical protein C1H76_1222 [Elsinoe australis]
MSTPFLNNLTLRQIRLLIFSAILVICVLLALHPASQQNVKSLSSHLKESISSHPSDAAPLHSEQPSLPPAETKHESPNKVESEPESERIAFMTFLTGTSAYHSDPDIMNDQYLQSVRIQGYQLLHHEPTKNHRHIPYVVMVTNDVPQEKRDRLTKDGLTVIPVDDIIAPEWLHSSVDRWAAVLTKLRAFQLTQYSRILFIDCDILINTRLDEIFDEEAAQKKPVKSTDNQTLADMSPKSDYLLAGVPETLPNHDFPPHDDQYKNLHYLTAGFFMFSPSQELYDYYQSIMAVPNIFDPYFPEQELLNYAHSEKSLVPWSRLSAKWNVNFATMEDKAKGAASMHEKWWDKGSAVHEYAISLRYLMEGFYEARDGAS